MAPKVQARKRRAAAREADPAERKSEVTRRKILDAAAQIFRDQGYSDARLSDIADAIGMKAGSLYYHFDSRESLVEAVMELGLARSRAAVKTKLASLPANANALDRLRAAIETHLVMAVEQEHYTSATIKLIWQVPLAIRERQLVSQRAYGDDWRKLLEDARRAKLIRSDLDPSVVRMAILGALNWAADWFEPGKKSAARVARDIASMVLDGLALKRD
jgi:AcrR family transcriptional regulator